MPDRRSIAERANGAIAPDAQQGLFDREVDDNGLEALMDEREERKKKAADAKTKFKEKDVLVQARIAEFELAVGEVARVGKYRVEKKVTRGGHRDFDVGDSTRLNITLFE